MSRSRVGLLLAVLGTAAAIAYGPMKSTPESPSAKVAKDHKAPKDPAPSIEVAPKAESDPLSTQAVPQPPKASQTQSADKGQMIAQARKKIWQKNWVEFELIDGFAVAYGDVLLGKVAEEEKDKLKNGRGFFEPPKSRLWPSNVIPYSIDEKLANPAAIHAAVRYFNENTVIRLVPYEGEEDVIVFVPSAERCASYIGMTGGQQPIQLGPQCGKDEVIHEIMHALGFVHEHSRVERDQFIEVLWDHVDEAYVNQFDIVPDTYVHEYRGSVFHFDYNSAMLYPPEAFAKKAGLITLKSRTGQAIEPRRGELSPVDIERLYYLYGY